MEGTLRKRRSSQELLSFLASKADSNNDFNERSITTKLAPPAGKSGSQSPSIGSRSPKRVLSKPLSAIYRTSTDKHVVKPLSAVADLGSCKEKSRHSRTASTFGARDNRGISPFVKSKSMIPPESPKLPQTIHVEIYGAKGAGKSGRKITYGDVARILMVIRSYYVFEWNCRGNCSFVGE